MGTGSPKSYLEEALPFPLLLLALPFPLLSLASAALLALRLLNQRLMTQLI